MNLLQIKQKMVELGISDSYMSDACGVGIRYFKQCTMGSKPMTKVLEQKIMGIFKTLEIAKNKEQRDKEEFENSIGSGPISFPEPKYMAMRQSDFEEEKEKDEGLPLEFLKGQINGLNRAKRIVRSIVSDQSFVHKEVIDILLSLDDELESVINTVLENKEV